MQIKIRALKVPDTISCITAGKIYLCKTEDEKGGTIVADNGETRTVYIPCCAHLCDNPWEIVPDKESQQ